jgi:hypothetical protein
VEAVSARGAHPGCRYDPLSVLVEALLTRVKRSNSGMLPYILTTFFIARSFVTTMMCYVHIAQLQLLHC